MDAARHAQLLRTVLGWTTDFIEAVPPTIDTGPMPSIVIDDCKTLAADPKASVEDLCATVRYNLKWIDAIPSDAVLPAMPGFDRDYIDAIVAGYDPDADED